MYSLSLPAVELVPGNLRRLSNLISNVKHNWFNLGLQLDISYSKLKEIEADQQKVYDRFLEMLYYWLRMAEPEPSWEALLTALEHESVECRDLAEHMRVQYQIPMIQHSTSEG